MLSKTALSHWSIRYDGADYEGQGADNVSVSIRELNTKGITVTPPNLPVPEGKVDSYTVELDSQPTGTVTVRIGGASGDVSVSPSRLTFTTSNWDTPQKIEVTAAEDADADKDAAVTLTHSASGGGYDNVTGGMVTVTIDENTRQVRGVTVTPKSLTVMEGGPSRSYTVVLTAEPTARVQITIEVTGGEESLVVMPTTLTFTQNTWSVPRTVTVQAKEDANAAAPTATLMHTATGGGYDSMMVEPVSITIRDNDTLGITVDPTSLEIAEGERESFTVVLDAQPASTRPGCGGDRLRGGHQV